MAYALITALGAAQVPGCASSSGEGNRSSTGASATLSDAALTTRVTAALTAAGAASPASVKVTTENGVVQLSGFVESPDQARRAEQIAREVEGVKQVYNDIRIKPRA
jgi:osmotically-inducible protein OsmY